MPITVTACHLCANDVKRAFDRSRVPYSIKTVGNKQKITVNCTSPSSWASGSLTAMCWRSVQFTYHNAVRNGNTVKCSNC